MATKTNIIKSILLMFLILSIGNLFRLESMSFIPVQIVDQNNPIVKKLRFVGVSSITTMLVNSIEFASRQYDVSTDMIIALTKTESDFKQGAVSSAGYNGLLQIPQKIYHVDANIIIGTRIFREKMNMSNGDIVKALCLYKGYPVGSARGKQQAQKVIALYNKIREATT